MPARLKVFTARLGFFDTAVAAASQKAALEAWGMHQDLFKDGSASQTDDPAAQVALEQPGVVLRRMAGSTGPYEVTPALSGDGLVPAGPKATGRRAVAAPAKPKPPPDRSALTEAERALAESRGARETALADLERRRKALEHEAFELTEDHDRRIRDAETAQRKAKAAYLKAGGR